MRIKIEKRPDAPPLWSVEFLSGGGGGRLADGDGGLHSAGGGVLCGGVSVRSSAIEVTVAW